VSCTAPKYEKKGKDYQPSINEAVPSITAAKTQTLSDAVDVLQGVLGRREGHKRFQTQQAAQAAEINHRTLNILAERRDVDEFGALEERVARG
jgi:hypothetical protein